jgi:hypothetical protein
MSNNAESFDRWIRTSFVELNTALENRYFIEEPAADLKPDHLADVTASGPPLPALIRSLEVLKDMRVAAKRGDLITRHDDLAWLKSCLRRGLRRTGARSTQ